MVRTKQRRGRRIVVVGALLVLAIVLVLWYMLAGRLDIPSPVPTPPGPEMSAVNVARPKDVVVTSHPFDTHPPIDTVGRVSSVHFWFVYV